MHPLRYRALYLIPAWFYVGLIFYYSLIPQPPVLLTFEQSDKLEHLVTYGILMFGFCQIYRSRSWRWVHALAFIAMGIWIEFLQRSGGQRMFEVADMVADGAGVMLGLLAGSRYGSLLERIERGIKG